MHTSLTQTQLQSFKENDFLLHQTADGRVTLACKGVCIHVIIQCALTHFKYDLIPHVNHELLASRQAAYVWAYLLC